MVHSDDYAQMREGFAATVRERDELERMLAGLCDRLRSPAVSDEGEELWPSVDDVVGLTEWFTNYQHRQQEAHDRLRKQALSKLTPEEAKALGVS